MPSASRLDAVTVDGFGTLLELDDPTERLRRALHSFGVSRDRDTVRAAFRAEATYYRPRSLTGHDANSLRALRTDCVRVFLEHLQADIDPSSFVEPFVGSIAFRVIPGAVEALEALSGAGLALACVSNWDVGLHQHLDSLHLSHRFDVVIPSASVGAEKPDPRIFAVALERLGVAAPRALHVGDDDIDRIGASAAGLAFAPAPLATLPSRLAL